MEIREITKEEYAALVKENTVIFCQKDFLELNKDKVDTLHYLVAGDKKDRVAFAIGEKNGEWKAPFSAPFASPVHLEKNPGIEYFWKFIELLNDYAAHRGAKSISVLLPPSIYGRSTNAKWLSAFLGNGFFLEYEELNHSLHINTYSIDEYKNTVLQSKARNKLNVALKSDLCFLECRDEDSKKEAYEIIQENRASKGYPLRMTLEQVLDTIKIVEHNFFIVKKGEESIAAAIVFFITKDMVQVIYWGDKPDVGVYKPMNFLAYELINYYQNKGITCIDIGPSTENGVPNIGLCSFKESIGCEVSAKYRLTKKFM